MAAEQITLAPDFQLLIDQAGLSKTAMAEAAGVNRLVIYRALHPERAGVRGTLRATTAWSLARVYAKREGIEPQAAFALLFYVGGCPVQEMQAPAVRNKVTEDLPTMPAPASDQVDSRVVPPPASEHGDLPLPPLAIEHSDLPVAPPVEPEQALQSEHQQRADIPLDGPIVTTGVRLDAATMHMLEALMEAEERSTKSEMIRLLIKRAYRARFAHVWSDAPDDSTSAC